MSSIIKVNTFQDANGNALFNSDGSGNVTTSASGMQNTPSFLATLSSNQTISNNTNTKIQLDTVDYDTDSAFDNTTNYRFTVPSGKAGKYLFTFSHRTDLAIDSIYQMSISLNGTTLKRSESKNSKPNATGSSSTVGSTIINMSVGDYVELFMFQATGSAQLATADYCSLSGMRLIGA
jgi:hypothetical protein